MPFCKVITKFAVGYNCG